MDGQEGKRRNGGNEGGSMQSFVAAAWQAQKEARGRREKCGVSRGT